jgi:hypothetical protein
VCFCVHPPSRGGRTFLGPIQVILICHENRYDETLRPARRYAPEIGNAIAVLKERVEDMDMPGDFDRKVKMLIEDMENEWDREGEA